MFETYADPCMHVFLVYMKNMDQSSGSHQTMSRSLHIPPGRKYMGIRSQASCRSTKTNDCSLFREFLDTHSLTMADWSRYRGTLTDAENILIANDSSHSRMRRQLAHAFSERALRSQESYLKHYVDLLISKLRAESDAGQPADMVKFYNFTTFDVLGDLAFGESFGCLESGGYHPWVRIIVL